MDLELRAIRSTLLLKQECKNGTGCEDLVKETGREDLVKKEMKTSLSELLSLGCYPRQYNEKKSTKMNLPEKKQISYIFSLV